MRKVWAIFLVPVVLAAAAAAVVGWLRPSDPPGPPAGPPSAPDLPSVTGYTPDEYARFVAAYPADRGGPTAGRRAFLQVAAFDGEQVAAYRAVDPADAAEAFRELARQTHRRPAGRPTPGVPWVRTAGDRLRDLVAAHEARCGPDPDPATGLHKGYLRLWDGAWEEADRLLAAAVDHFPADPDGDPLSEGELARAGRAEAVARSGRWREAARAGLPPGVSAEAVFRALGGEDGAADAGRFLDACDGPAPADPVLTRCRAVYEYRRGRYESCLAAADRFLAAPAARQSPAGGWEAVVVLRVKGLARLGRFAEADASLAAARAAGLSSAAADRVELLVALLAGDEGRAGTLLGGRVGRGYAYQDGEAGPALAADRYAGLRAKYPPHALSQLAPPPLPAPAPVDR